MSTCNFTTVKIYWFYLLSCVFYQLIMLLGDCVLLGSFKLVDKVLDVSGVGANFSECRYDGYFILYYIHE